MKYMLGLLAFIWMLIVLGRVDVPSFVGTVENFKHNYYDRQFELLPQKGDNPLKRGWMYYYLGRYDKSRTIMEQIIKQDENISAIYCLGLIDLKEQHPEAAAKNLEVVVGQAPAHVPTLVALGKSYYQMKCFGPARENLEEAVAFEPDNAEARLWLGKTYLQLQNLP